MHSGGLLFYCHRQPLSIGLWLAIPAQMVNSMHERLSSTPIPLQRR
jgi:hypothetical protein